MAREFLRLNAQQACAKDAILYADVTDDGATLYVIGGQALPTTAERVTALGLTQITATRFVAWDWVITVEVTADDARLTLQSGDQLDVDDPYASQIAARAGLR